MDFLQKIGAKVMKREYWGLRPLAYEVAKNRRGHYVMLCVEANLASLTPFITELQHSEEIIRNMEVRVEKIESKPSVMLQRSDDSEAA